MLISPHRTTLVIVGALAIALVASQNAATSEVSVRPIAALEIRGYQTDFESLVALLEDESADVRARQWATMAIAQIGGESAYRILVEAVDNLHLNVRASAIDGLGVLRDPRALVRLNQLMKESEHVDLQLKALYSIYRIGTEESGSLIAQTALDTRRSSN